MSIEKRTIVDQVEARPDGVLQIRLCKQLVEDGRVLSFEYHRTALEPGVDPKAQIDLVNAHLQTLGAAPLVDYSLVSKMAATLHTPEAIAAFRAKVRDAHARAAGGPAA